MFDYFVIKDSSTIEKIREQLRLKDLILLQKHFKLHLVIILEPSSGPAGPSVTVTGAGFDPTSTVTIDFGSTSDVTTNPSPLKTTATGFFTATFNVPPSSNGDHTVKAMQGSNEDSKPFTVTPDITLNPTSGLVNTLVIVTCINFDPISNVIITFAGNPVTTIPATVTTDTNGDFSANFTVPNSTPEARIVSATDEGSNSDSTIFTVTAPSTLTTNQRLSTNLSNVSWIENPTNQSNATLALPSSNQSNATIPVITNNSFHASSPQAIENSSTTPSVQEINITSREASIDNTINDNPANSASTQSNDTSNNKKSSEKIIPISPPTSNDQGTPTTLTKDNTTHEIAQNESNNPLSDAKVKNKDISSKDSETVSSDSVTEKPSSLTEDKTVTKVKSPNSDNQPEKQSVSSDSIKRDRALVKNYSKYQESVKSQQKEAVAHHIAINDRMYVKT